MSPVHDSDGVYRYSIGVLADAAFMHDDASALDALRSALPKTMQADAQPAAYDASLRNVPADAQLKQYHAATLAFTRLKWSMSWSSALTTLLSQEAAHVAFASWLQREVPEDVSQLQLLLAALPVAEMPMADAKPLAIDICSQRLGTEPADGFAAMAMLQEQTERASTALSLGSLPRFARSKECLALIDKMQGPRASAMEKREDLLWSAYDVPPDCAGWVHAFIGVAEMHPACIVLSDMSMPGNPMVYVNREFCRVTMYGKHEATGRNCRFLQGPRTEPQSVAVVAVRLELTRRAASTPRACLSPA